MSTTPQTTSSSSAELALKPSGSAAVTQRSLGGQLIHAVSSSAMTVIVLLIAIIWSVPTFGLFLSSFRTPQAIHSTGWWNGIFPPWHFTIENYQTVLQSQNFGQA